MNGYNYIYKSKNGMNIETFVLKINI